MVALNAVEELLTALRVPDVLNTDVHSLLHITVADDLIDNHADGSGSDVVDNTSPAALRIYTLVAPTARNAVRCTYPW